MTSLLNNAQQPCYSRGGTKGSSKDHNHGKPLPMSWVEDSSQSPGRDDREIASFRDESRVEATKPEESDSQSGVGPPFSAKHVHETALEANNRSKRPSMGFSFGTTSQLPIQLARNDLSW